MQPPKADKPSDEFTMTPDESKRLEECFKDKKFRDLLSDYVKEISNPQTKLAYEEYLKQVESEGGAPQNRKLMKPIPVFCIKAKIIQESKCCHDTHQKHKNVSKDKKHIFINVCSGNLVKEAKLTNSSGLDHVLNSSGSRQAGLCWSVPYVLGHKRFDSNDGHIIYDIAFSETTITLLNQQISFKNIVIQTALEAVDKSESEYQIYINNKHGKKYKLLKTNKCKGNIDPPLMSVSVESEPQRMVNKADVKSEIIQKKDKILKRERKENIKYKIVESGVMDMGQYWSDNNLLMQPLKKCKQIFIVCKLKMVKCMKDIDVKVNKSKKSVSINVKNGKYKLCVIELKRYDIIPSSMNASWYRQKNELKLTFNIAPFTRTQIEEMKRKYLNVYPIKEDNESENEIIIPKKQSGNSENSASFVLKEVQTKRIKSASVSDDCKGKEQTLDSTPLCHHKLPMTLLSVEKSGANYGKSYWVCTKTQNEKCTAFKWKKMESEYRDRKRVIQEFEIEKREKFDKIVLLVRITNILRSSVHVCFGENGGIEIEFETHEYKYRKTIEIKQCIDILKSKFDLNCRNLLIMAVKAKKEENKRDEIDSCVDDILNDTVLFDID